ncbi:hypothetical protein Tco_1321061 [Tanacetum coccineum]
MYKRKFVIVCHEKVVRIPLEGDEILQVHGERPQGVVKTLMNTKVKFRVYLVHGATSVAKSPYCLAPLEMQELSEQLRELQDKELELLRKEKLYAKIVNTILPLTERIEKGRVKLRRVRAMSMTIQSSVKDKILATSSESSKYEYEIRYHPGKANVVTDALSRKERVEPRCVRAMAAQSEAFKQENGMIRTVVMDAAHASRRKPLEFEVGERVMLKVSPWKGVIRFGKKGKLAPSLHVPLDEIKVDKTLRFVEEPVENSDREVKSNVEIQKVIHTVKIDEVRQIVDVKSLGKSADEIDKETVSFGEMQLKQEDRSCVHASIELHLHSVHVVANGHEPDQH